MAEPSSNGTANGPREAAKRASRHARSVARIPPAIAARFESQLLVSPALHYKPSPPLSSARSAEFFHYDFFVDIEEMRRDAAVALPLLWLAGPMAHAEWEIEARNQEDAEFIARQLQWFWSNACGRIYDEGCAYGWSPALVGYDIQDGLLVQKKFDTVNPRDAQPCRLGGKPVAVEIHNLYSSTSRLWAWQENVPNQAFWYAHRARYGSLYGRSQIRPAWRPWRRLMGRDGAEDVIDLGVYRNSIGDTVVRHPNRVQTAAASAAPSFATNGTWHTRTEAQHIAENRKAGAGIAVSSETDGKGNRLWDIETLKVAVDIGGLINYVEYLERLCSKAIGVPPELFQAAQTGSGYSGRAIPLQGFLVSQQAPMEDMTRAWVEQIGLPLLKWNYGPDAWARVTAVPLIESYSRSAAQIPGLMRGNYSSVPGQNQQMAQPPQGMPGQQQAMQSPTMLSTFAGELDIEALADRLERLSDSDLRRLDAWMREDLTRYVE